MARLTIVMDVPDVDPTIEDPEEIAAGLIDWDGFRANGAPSPDVVGAEWGAPPPMLPSHVQVFDLDLPDVWHHMLRVALATEIHERLYKTSATFKHAIDQLACWLPLWVNAMSVQAQRDDVEIAQRIELAKRFPFAPGAVVMTVLAGDIVEDRPHRFRAVEGTIAGTREPCTLCHRMLADPIHEQEAHDDV